MNQNKLYCRNGTQPTSSSSNSTMSTGTSTSIGGNAMQEYINCGSISSTSDFSCKELLTKNANTNKFLSNHNSSNSNICVVAGGGSGYCSNNSNETGNFINIMPIQIGSLQYHRRKITAQEYQPRIVYNTADYNGRDEYYNISTPSGSGGAAVNSRVNTASPSSQNQHHSHHQFNQLSSNHNNHLAHHHHHHSQQQPQQHQHSLAHSVHESHALPQSGSSHLNSSIDTIDETYNRVAIGPSCHPLSETEPDHSNTVNEQVLVPATTSISSIPVPGAPLMYTVHRVVTTAQIQTAAGNTYASSSSVSSVVSTLRNESDVPITSVTNKPSQICETTRSTVGTMFPPNFNDNGSNYLNQNMQGGAPSLRCSPVMSTKYLTHQSKCSNLLENHHQPAVGRLPNNNFTSHQTSMDPTFLNGAKTSATISRPLQNVIPTCVYLMSRIAVHMEIEGTAQCPTQVMLAAALGCEELGIANKLLAQSIFGLWMTSSFLEIQLKSHHRPYVVRVAWKNLLEKFCHRDPAEMKYDEPMIVLKRNVFFSKRDEEKIKDYRILELLYEEAKSNVLNGRYIMESVHSLMLGGIQARIELGPFNSNTHTISFFRENQSRFLPQHVAKSTSWSWLPVSRKNSAEVRLLEQFKRVPQTATTRKLMRKYLEFCWALPFYGAAFFHGQVEQPARGFVNLVNQKDANVLIAVNERGIFVIDSNKSTLLLGLRYEDFSWDFAKPSASDDPNCLTCIFLQFDIIENGVQISKLVQIFSKQAAMIDALIMHFAEQMRKRKQEGNTTEYHDEPNPIQNNGNGVLCNKLSRLTLASFDEEGRCISQMGSLSISY